MKKYILLGIVILVIGSVATAYFALSSNGDAVKTALNNMRNAKSYHAEVVVGSTSFNGDYDFANNKSKGNASVNGANASFVVNGSDYYISTDSGQTYAKSSSSSLAQLATLPKDAMNRISDSVNSGSLLLAKATPETDTIGNATCKHLSGKNSSNNSDIWVATDGSYVCQIKVSGTSGGQGDFTIKITNFNAAVDISVPAASDAGSGSTTDPTPTPGSGTACLTDIATALAMGRW